MNALNVVELNKYDPAKYNVLTPVTIMEAPSDLQRILVKEVRLDTNIKTSRDIYYEKSSGKYAIAKVGGVKLASAANISIAYSESEKPDVCVKCIEMATAVGKPQLCGTCPNRYDVKYRVIVEVPDPCGIPRRIEKKKEIYGELEKENMTEAQFKRFLPHRASQAESKAMMRCIRDALGLAAGYTLDELKKPFIIAQVVPNFDAPEIRQAVAKNYLQSMGMLFEIPGKGEQKALSASATGNAKQSMHEAPALPSDVGNYDEGEFPLDMEDGGVPYPLDEPSIYCVDCGLQLVSTTSAKGKAWTAEDISEYSKRTFGRILCPNCQRFVRSREKVAS